MPTSNPIRMKNVRLSFPKLFTPKSFKKDDGSLTAPRFEASFLLDPTDKAHKAAIDQIVAAATEILEDHYNGKVPKGIDMCFGYADASEILVAGNKWHGKEKEYDGYGGMFYISSNQPASQGRPTIVDRGRQPLLVAEDGTEPAIPYAGCFVNASVTLWTQDNEWGKRVNANLRAVQFSKDGEAFGVQAADAEEEFDVLEDEDGDDDFLD